MQEEDGDDCQVRDLAMKCTGLGKMDITGACRIRELFLSAHYGVGSLLAPACEACSMMLEKHVWSPALLRADARIQAFMGDDKATRVHKHLA